MPCARGCTARSAVRHLLECTGPTLPGPTTHTSSKFHERNVLMLLSKPLTTRPTRQRVDERYRMRFGDKSPSPEPRMPEKHALNPPIVTVLGAGIAGLTAAHELVERGFLVQVVEAEEDPRCPGRPLVGG